EGNAALQVGFRVFGHRGDNSQAGKTVSCQSTELLVPMQAVDKAALQQQAGAWQPTGWTPISLALQRAGEDLVGGEGVKNNIIMVTDGEETCAGDPCAVAAALRESDAEVRIDVVGFGTTPEQDTLLRCIADNSGGSYTSAANGEALATTLQELTSASIARSYLRIVSIDASGQPTEVNEIKLDIQSFVDAQGQPAKNGQGLTVADQTSSTISQGAAGVDEQAQPLADGQARFELLPGSYSFSVNYGPGVGFVGGSNASRSTTYTAVIAEGQETVATIGIGALAIDRQGLEQRYVCRVQLEQQTESGWVSVAGSQEGIGCIAGNSLVTNDAAKPAQLPPGRYRLTDHNKSSTPIGEFDILAGKTVSVRVSGQ
ncbi:MAG: VWA domain-containing protein, partial [Roseiflexaceae bacterium]|nr:VWA domain-containing protein [Roseiflexaceae bacterium]